MKRTTISLVSMLVISSAIWSGATVRADDGSTQSAVIVMAAGDIACDPNSGHFNAGRGDLTHCQMKASSDLLLSGHPDAVLALGDNQYGGATISTFMQSYDPTWGRVRDVTYPAVGNHEYDTPDASDYFAYFGNRAGSNRAGYYSFDLGGWHIISLNSNCAQAGGCEVGSTQERWLLADLAAHRNLCTLAYWHHPRFTSGTNRNTPSMQTFWDDLYAHGADIVLNGHDHGYERFAPQSPSAQADSVHGIREFIVGTGGASHSVYLPLQPNSEVHEGTTYGVLRLILRKDSYDWQFIPETQAGNGSFSDAGTGACHANARADVIGSSPRAVGVVSGVGSWGMTGRLTVDFTSTKPGRAYVLFGPGPGCSGLVMTALGDQGAGTTRHWFVVTGNDLPGMVGDIGILPGMTYWYETATFTQSGTEIDDNGGKCYSVKVPPR